jgi:hypothetical protein
LSDAKNLQGTAYLAVTDRFLHPIFRFPPCNEVRKPNGEWRGGLVFPRNIGMLFFWASTMLQFV